MKARWSIGAGLIMLVTGTGSVHADFIANLDVNVTPQAGSYLYTYTLTNDVTSTMPAVALEITVDADADLQSPMAPTGWITVYSPGDLLISFLSTDPTADLAPGESYQFQFLSALGPGPNSYFASGFDPSGGDPGVVTGTVLSPSAQAVPEPASLVLMTIGLGIMPFVPRAFARMRSASQL